MARFKTALKDFVSRHCLIQPSPVKSDEEEYYVMDTEGVRYFLAQTLVREMLTTVNQTEEVMNAAKKNGDYEGIILAYWKDAPDAGLDKLKLPVKLVEGFTEKQAFIFLRALDAILHDVEEGKIQKDRLEGLFQDTADIIISAGDDGDRVYNINGKLSATDHRRYMERYAEQVASKTLFDIAKSLNGRLEQYVPEDLRGKYFFEGRDFSDRKIRYGQEVSTELCLSDEGAWLYTSIANKSPQLRENMSKLFKQAMIDPFGLSLTHYMGKHNVLKAGKRPLVKIAPLSSFFGWLKGLFGGGAKED